MNKSWIGAGLLLTTACAGAAGNEHPPVDGEAVLTSSAQVPVGHAPVGGSPEWIVESFFLSDSFPNKNSYLGGEMASHYADAATLGAGLPADVSGSYRLLERDGARTVYAVALRNSSQSQDWYAYLQEDETGWKLHEVRSLALPPFFHLLIERLANDPAPTEQSRVQLASMRLTVRSDSALAIYFAEKKESLRELAGRFAADPALRLVSRPTEDPEGHGSSGPQDIVERLGRLQLSSVYRDQEHPGCIFLSIGGVLDNAVGYLYAPSPCRVPRMTPDDFIYVERLDDEWFLFKTT